jgi:hypothetical protein
LRERHFGGGSGSNSIASKKIAPPISKFTFAVSA